MADKSEKQDNRQLMAKRMKSGQTLLRRAKTNGSIMLSKPPACDSQAIQSWNIIRKMIPKSKYDEFESWSVDQCYEWIERWNQCNDTHCKKSSGDPRTWSSGKTLDFVSSLKVTDDTVHRLEAIKLCGDPLLKLTANSDD
eukprot:751360_1